MSAIRALAIATCVCAVPAVALAAKPTPTTVSIAVTPSTVTFGKPVIVSGTTAPSVAVTLRADAFPFNGSFAQVARATSNAAGAYTFTVTPDSATHYRVDAKAHPSASSAIAAVAVRWRVTRAVSTRRPKRGARVRFSGTVAPAHTGSTVELQRKTASGFATVKTAVLAAATPTSSSYSLRVRVSRNGSYRVHVAADASHLAGNSSRVTLVVH